MDQASPHGSASIDWVVSPARQRPFLAVFVAGVLLLIGCLVGVFAEDWIWGALAVIFLFATVTRFYLPSRVRLSETHVRAEFPLRTRQVAWDQIEWIRHDAFGALVRTRRSGWLQSAEFTILFGPAGSRAIEGLRTFAPEGVVQSRDADREAAS